MLVAERWHKIVQLVNERASIRVTELAELCAVTEETIRRDLDKLEGEGKLLRSHGGAVSIRESQPDIPFPVREATNMEEKRLIAAEAVKRIEPRDRIVLDASTTACCIAEILPDVPLTVLTNSIKVAMELSGKERVEVISTGGLLSGRSLSYLGPLAERSLESYHVNKAFLSCKGVHPERGISDSNELQAMIKRKMLAIADESYLLIDYSKFGVQAFAYVAGWSEIDCVITDGQTSDEDVRALRDHSVQVVRLEG